MHAHDDRLVEAERKNVLAGAVPECQTAHGLLPSAPRRVERLRDLHDLSIAHEGTAGEGVHRPNALERHIIAVDLLPRQYLVVGSHDPVRNGENGLSVQRLGLHAVAGDRKGP